MQVADSLSDSELLAAIAGNQKKLTLGSNEANLLTKFVPKSPHAHEQSMEAVVAVGTEFSSLLPDDLHTRLGRMIKTLLRKVPLGKHPTNGHMLIWDIMRATIPIAQQGRNNEQQLSNYRHAEMLNRELWDHQDQWSDYALQGETLYQQLAMKWADIQRS